MLLIANSTIVLTSLLLTLGLTQIVRQALIKRALLDHPNERSSHSVPTPRGGGWAIVLVLIPGLVIATLSTNAFATYAPLIGGVVVLAFVSWRDDLRGLSPLLRLLAHLAAATLGSLALPDGATLFDNALPFGLDRAVMIVGWAWFMNLYNFMDGIDGITGVETVSIATGVCLAMTAAGLSDPFTDWLTLLLTGASLGFLAHNWHPAKIFLGDIGSVPLGFLSGFALIVLAAHGHMIAALILPLYYLADSGLTIAKRALRGEKIWQAHRQHFYQRAAAGLGRHDKVVYRIIAANSILIALSVFAIQSPWLALGLAVVTVALLLIWMHKSGIRKG